jgi:hypothetical protein
MGLILRHLVRAFVLTIPCGIIAACGDGGSPATPVSNTNVVASAEIYYP